ncbi:putative membrane lipoprotein [Corchorus capsularis]|uniref:Putative membrane lipoprotein n=1 Tax=Corchorus capsularis TaxID=210143 RepID=A0A1R3HSF2_COCAP|nr:putative membrane lipoprotein [Corchorus capsularis]
MMMKGALLVLVLAFSATLFKQGNAADDAFADSKWGFRGFRPGFSWRRHWPAFPPHPAHDVKPPEEVTKCAGAFKAAAVCLKPPIGEECCTALQTVQADCGGIKFLDPVLKAHCSTDAAQRMMHLHRLSMMHLHHQPKTEVITLDSKNVVLFIFVRD